MSQAVIWALVPGAGTGQRMGASLPKQYLLLAGQTIAERTLSQLVTADLFSKIIIALADDDNHFLDLPIAQSAQIETVVGGASRAASVLNGLHALADYAAADDWVMVHDIARPLITVEAMNKLVNAVGPQDVAAILATRIHDTVKQSDIYNSVPESLPFVETTLDRRRLWLAQTPQMVRYGLLVEALTQAEKQHEVTDEASAVEFLGRSVLLVENTQQNIKITTDEDLRLAEYYLLDSVGLTEVG
ncbi:MAG: 2-C-methyl-D-erythritol 4-phosphate cytidylyltransferase [Actinobacteria bacterium TMED172]|nr:2-C-methyl-D-erythritol 4-phosphate cytidylyltransferase [Cellvibrionales bacterium]OUW33390.1 MAG: 2-C-methyl-D-erythritol 4-phosphate cytidylyltransferase [Actinobacteria bacterium TMED172]|tara:strand:+ start:1286 stop:2020 length:735 start_codon:yes stop_codon:yes gene_type:complete